jgi:hypothetical protein
MAEEATSGVEIRRESAAQAAGQHESAGTGDEVIDDDSGDEPGEQHEPAPRGDEPAPRSTTVSVR